MVVIVNDQGIEHYATEQFATILVRIAGSPSQLVGEQQKRPAMPSDRAAL